MLFRSSLDNAINLIGVEEDSYEEEDTIDEVVDEIVESTNITKNINITDKKQKLKKKKDQVESKDYSRLRKEMYKNKNKLMKNSKDENIILFKDGMTVGDLASELNISGTDIIKKLMGLGLMLSLNNVIDFEQAEIVALEYNKTLKREETQDVSNFEEYEIVDNGPLEQRRGFRIAHAVVKMPGLAPDKRIAGSTGPCEVSVQIGRAHV